MKIFTKENQPIIDAVMIIRDFILGEEDLAQQKSYLLEVLMRITQGTDVINNDILTELIKRTNCDIQNEKHIS